MATATTTTLSSLKLSTVRRSNQTSPVILRRRKMLKQLGEQIALATAQQNKTTYAVTKFRTVKNIDTGERRSIEVQKRVKSWAFTADNGKLALCVRYGSRVLELAKGKFAVELADATQLVPTLQLIATAVEAGELDEQMATASTSLRTGFK